MQTRAFSGNSYQLLSQFKAEFGTPDKLKSVGWLPVPNVDVRNSDNWNSAVDIVSQTEFADYVDGNFFKYPIVLSNHNLYKFDSGALARLSKCDGDSKMYNFVNYYRNGVEYSKLQCIHEEFNNFSVAYSFDSSAYSTSVIPSDITLTRHGALVSTNCWFTDGHIEICGDDSIATTVIGQKLFIISRRGRVSRQLYSSLRDLRYLIHFLKRGPQDRSERDNIRFYFSTPDSFLVQPALSVHSVLTLGPGTACVTGWEGFKPSDITRFKQILLYYCPGVSRGALISFVEKYGLQKTLEFYGLLNGRYGDLYDHLLAAYERNIPYNLQLSTSNNARGRPVGSTKKRKALNISRTADAVRSNLAKQSEFFEFFSF